MPTIRDATADDVPAIVTLLAEAPAETTPRHYDAFETLDEDPRNRLLVLEEDDQLIGCLQITFIPGLGRGGGERALLEAVRVREDRRGEGLGARLVEHAVDLARERGCVLVQLTSNKGRADAHRFYERLGFVASHEGFKLKL